MSAVALRRRLLLCALLAAPALPAGALEKCISPAGKVTYSEQACPPGSKASTVRGTAPVTAPPAEAQGRPAAAAQSAKPGGPGAAKAAPKKPQAPQMGGTRQVGQVEIRYFDVQAKDYGGLLAAVMKDGLHRSAEWSLAYQYTPRRAGKACSVATLDTTLKEIITLPRWTPPRDASPKLVSEWTRYVGALKKHQEGHLEFGRDMHDAFRSSLAITQTRCEKLAEAVKSQYDVLLERHRALEKAYDFETAQGRTEGVEFAQR